MLLPPADLDLFYHLHKALMHFVNQRLQVLPVHPPTPDHFAALPPPVRLQVRDALRKHLDLIDAFVAENPAGLAPDELDIVRSWKHQVGGKFILLRQLKKYAVFLTAEDSPTAYGVLALSEPFEAVLGHFPLPVMVETVLLPFKGQIIYDGLLNSFSVTFGPGYRRSFNDSFKEAKARQGVVTSLPAPDAPVAPPAKPKPAAKPKAKAISKDKTAAALQSILDLLEPFCKKHLNAEYAALCRKLAEKLARKRPSPITSGKPAVWADAIVRTIGFVNFLHDPSQKPYMKATDIDTAFGVGESTGAAKAKQVRDMLKVRRFDHEWMLAARMADSPMVWMAEVNGLLVDLRRMPREVQEIAFQKGLIPYVPADREGKKT